MTDVSDISSLPPGVVAALKKNRLIDDAGQWTQTTIKKSTDGSADGRTPLGQGPMVDPMVIQRLLAADSTPDKIWFPWMLFQSAGGREAQKRGEVLMVRIRDRWIKERLNGYTRNGVWHDAIPDKKKVEAMWERDKNKYIDTVVVGDQDMADDPHRVYGFYRHWPGKDSMYQQTSDAVHKFLKLAPKAREMNKFYSKQGSQDEMVSFNPNDYPTLGSLTAAIQKITQFHTAKGARNDVRIQTVYDDDYVTVIVPLTAAAAVRYGWDEWTWANRSAFEQALKTGNTWQNTWRNTTGRDASVFVYIQFKVPMPSWVAYANNKFRRHTLHNLALTIPQANLRNFNEDTIKLYDEENRANITLGAIKQQIRDEGTRKYDPEEEEYPIHRGPSVYKDQAEAEEVVKHLDAALDAIKHWAATFDPKSIVSDFMGQG